jgi:hypothetical protein
MVIYKLLGLCLKDKVVNENSFRAGKSTEERTTAGELYLTAWVLYS